MRNSTTTGLWSRRFYVGRFLGFKDVRSCFLLWTMIPDMFCLFFQSQCFGWMNRWGVGVDHRPSDGGKKMFVHGKLDGFGVFWMGTPSSRCVFSLVFWVTENICWPRFWESCLGETMPMNFSIWSVRLDLVYNGICWISGYPWYHRLDTFADFGCLYHHWSSNLRAFQKCTQWVNYMNFRSGFLKSVSVWGVVQHKGP